MGGINVVGYKVIMMKEENQLVIVCLVSEFTELNIRVNEILVD
jgi:hypothetical protein